MEVVLSIVALASFTALVAAWAIVPHLDEVQRVAEPGSTQVLGLN